MRRRLVLCLLPALLAAGCVSSTRGAARPSGAATPDVAARVAELEREAKVAEVELRRLRVQVAELEAALAEVADQLGEASRAASPIPAPAVSPPRGEIESSDLTLESGAPIGAVVRDRPPAMEGATPPAVRPTPSAVAVDAAAQALYDRGYTLYHQERYVDAETAFQRFLQAHGDTDLADNALYWIGESRFARADLRGALAAFDETVERYPSGNKVPDALLKAGDCLERLGDRERALASYEEVLRRFPASAAAERARERRDQLR